MTNDDPNSYNPTKRFAVCKKGYTHAQDLTRLVGNCQCVKMLTQTCTMMSLLQRPLQRNARGMPGNDILHYVLSLLSSRWGSGYMSSRSTRSTAVAAAIQSATGVGELCESLRTTTQMVLG